MDMTLITDMALNMAAHGAAAFDPDLARDVALAGVRVSMGTFFAASGANKLFVASRHATLRATLVKDHVPFVRFNEWWVPGWEFTGGLMLAVGLFSAFAASVLAIICLVAIMAEASKQVAVYAPINFADRVADWLYLPEVLYVVLLAVNVIAGTGRFSLDHLLF